MALNIPNTKPFGESLLQGIETGGNLYSRIMQPIISREEMENRKKLQEAQLAQQMKVHMDDLALRRAAEARLRQAADPMHDIQQFQALQNMMRGNGVPASSNQQQSPMPTQESGEGMGMFSPEGMASAQQQVASQQQTQAPNPGSNTSGVDLELMKQNPMLRGWFKHKFGYDPLAQAPQTPEEKQASALDLFKQKEQYKAAQEQKLPGAIKTLHENIIHLSPKAIDAVQHIIDIPSPFEPWGLGAVQAGQKAAHNKAVTAAAENYAKAKGWPNTKGSIEKAESILQRGKFETDFDYRKRLREYQDELRAGIMSSNQFLHPNKEVSEIKPENNVIEYVRINGKLVPKNG